jgi:hypothetical protein
VLDTSTGKVFRWTSRCITSDGERVLIARSADRHLIVFDTQTRRSVSLAAVLSKDEMMGPVFVAQGSTVAVGGFVVDLRAATLIGTYEGEVRALGNDGRVLVDSAPGAWMGPLPWRTPKKKP